MLFIANCRITLHHDNLLYSMCRVITTQWLNRRRKTSVTNICTSHFIARVRNGILKVCVWEGVWDRTELKYFDPHSFGLQRCVFLVLQMLNRNPGVHSAGCWLSLLHLISIFSGHQFSQGPEGPFGRVWLSLP